MYTVLSVSKLFEVDCLHQHCFGPVAIAWIGMECCSNFLCILITVMYFKDRNWISKILNCISCSVVCKIVFCSEFPDIPDNAEEREGEEGEEEHRYCKALCVSRKHKKNTGNCKTLCVSRKRNKIRLRWKLFILGSMMLFKI